LEPVGQYLKDQEFVNKIQTSGYVTIVAKDLNNKIRRFRKIVSQENQKKPVVTVFVVFDIGATPQSTADMVKVLKQIIGDRQKNNYEIVLIYDPDTPIKTAIIKKLEEMKNEKTTTGYLNIDYYKYTIFLTNIFNHSIMSKHEIVSMEDEKQILIDMHCHKDQLPKMLRGDPVCVYLGADILDIIKVTSLSEACGEKIEYKVVVL
jgi:DNA-directed RNA polymerase subunit H (RpoH/RPB5)